MIQNIYWSKLLVCVITLLSLNHSTLLPFSFIPVCYDNILYVIVIGLYFDHLHLPDRHLYICSIPILSAAAAGFTAQSSCGSSRTVDASAIIITIIIIIGRKT